MAEPLGARSRTRSRNGVVLSLGNHPVAYSCPLTADSFTYRVARARSCPLSRLVGHRANRCLMAGSESFLAMASGRSVCPKTAHLGRLLRQATRALRR